MIRSRRLVLVAAVVALGLSACGNPNTTTPVADKPQVIQLAGRQSGTGAAAPAAADSANAATGSKIAIMGSTKFVYDGELPALDSPAGSWFFAPDQKPDVDRIAKLAAALGVQGDVRTLPAEQGGGWAVGPEDYSAAVLTVGSDGMLSWWLSAGQPTVTSIGGCASVSGVATEPALGAPGVADAVPPAATAPAEAVPAPDVVAPDCPVPNPPVGVPTKDEALAKAKQMFADWGYDVSTFQFDDAYADAWGASINASLVLEGLKAPVMLSVGFGENGTVTYASGYLATPQRGADYPTIGAAAGLERLKAQNQFVGPLDGTGVLKATDNVAASDAALVPDTAPGIAPAVEPTIVPCEPEAATVDCLPTGTDSITVTLNSVKPDLIMVWAADNTIWLLPAYTFGAADGGLYTVNAVDDAYIQQADPGPVTTGPVINPGLPVPEPAPAGGGSGGDIGTVPAPGVVGAVADTVPNAEPNTTAP